MRCCVVTVREIPFVEAVVGRPPCKVTRHMMTQEDYIDWLVAVFTTIFFGCITIGMVITLVVYVQWAFWGEVAVEGCL
jgi:uncharacterized protein (DUF983 family)